MTATLVVPTRTPLFDAPYDDDDRLDYGERASARQFEIRAAADPPFSGSLVLEETDISGISRRFRLGTLAWESVYDVRLRYRDDATPKKSTTLAAGISAGATNVKLTSVANIAVGNWLFLETSGSQIEGRRITAVGTAGSGGTGVTVADPFAYAHTNGHAAIVYYWGAWSGLRIRASKPPTIVLTGPANGATVTNPTQPLSHSYSSPSGKPQARRVRRIYVRTGGVDDLVYRIDKSGVGTADLIPRFLLDDGKTYAWETDVYDTDGLKASSSRRTFTTSFSVPAVVANLATEPDEENSALTLTWDAAAGVDHYRVYWRNAQGDYVRVDGGPEELDDGRLPLRTPGMNYYGARFSERGFGTNEFIVTVHNGWAESEPSYVDGDLPIIPGNKGHSAIVRDGNAPLTFAFAQQSGPMDRAVTVETIAPPGRGTPMHRIFGVDGRRVSLQIQYRPVTDGDMVTRFDTLARLGWSFWYKPPPLWLFDPLRAIVTRVSPAPQVGGIATLQVDLDETKDGAIGQPLDEFALRVPVFADDITDVIWETLTGLPDDLVWEDTGFIWEIAS